VDFLPEFLDELQSRANDHSVADRITTLNCSMDTLPFAEGEFDVIWSEGAVYNTGFEAGVSAWRRFLKPEGKLIVSEITWLRAARPPELQSHWETEYPEIDVASAKIGLLERRVGGKWLCEMTSAFIIKELRGARVLRLFCGRSTHLHH
jgi:SAM-dependent methyltransferase